MDFTPEEMIALSKSVSWRYKADMYRNQIADLKLKIDLLEGYVNTAEWQANLHLSNSLRIKLGLTDEPK